MTGCARNFAMDRTNACVFPLRSQQNTALLLIDFVFAASVSSSPALIEPLSVQLGFAPIMLLGYLKYFQVYCIVTR